MEEAHEGEEKEEGMIVNGCYRSSEKMRKMSYLRYKLTNKRVQNSIILFSNSMIFNSI